MKKLILIVVGIALALGVYKVFVPQKSPRYNLVLISIDTLRADRLGCYGYKTADTKNIDQLAQEGVLFEKCFAQAPLTFPSHASIMTGTDPTIHGIKDNLYYTFNSKELPTIASILKENYYQTAAVVSAAPLNHSKGLNAGFDMYSDVENVVSKDSSKFIAERVAIDSVGIANEYLDKMANKSSPFFFMVTFIRSSC